MFGAEYPKNRSGKKENVTWRRSYCIESRLTFLSLTPRACPRNGLFNIWGTSDGGLRTFRSSTTQYVHTAHQSVLCRPFLRGLNSRRAQPRFQKSNRTKSNGFLRFQTRLIGRVRQSCMSQNIETGQTMEGKCLGARSMYSRSERAFGLAIHTVLMWTNAGVFTGQKCSP